MKRINYMFYLDYLRGGDTTDKEILVSKANKSYLIGPRLNEKFDGYSFSKRVMSNSIYSINIYKKFSARKCKRLIEDYIKNIGNNEVLEIFKDGTFVKHIILQVPGVNNENT